MFYFYVCLSLTLLNFIAWLNTGADILLFATGIGSGMTIAVFVEYLQ